MASFLLVVLIAQAHLTGKPVRLGHRPEARGAPPRSAAIASLPVSAQHPRADAADAWFEAAVQHCESCVVRGHGELSAEVPRLLRATLDADFERFVLRASHKSVQNVTCMQPAQAGSGSQLFDNELIGLSLRHGRVCGGGDCCDACSRVLLPGLVTPAESAAFRERLTAIMEPADMYPHHNLYLSACSAVGDVRTTLLYIRLVERMRRAVAYEYGLQLDRVAPRQTFVSRITGVAGDEARQSVHTDEGSCATYHYSGVLYLSTQHEDFEGGAFSFTDPPGADDRSRDSGDRRITPLSPSSGLAVIFSSGWENMHFVEPVVSGCRHAVPVFFVTHADEQPQSDHLADDVSIAKALWRSALMPTAEEDCRRFLRQWHQIIAPGSSVSCAHEILLER